jgi:hypothetical protein
MQVQLLARAASDNLEALRNTDDIQNAIDQENAAIKQMQDEQKFVREAAEVMFDEGGQIFGRDVSNFGKLASTIKFEREAGNVKIKILDINDPEITGIDLSNLKEQEGE